MVKERMDLLELMRKRGVDGDVDFLREALRVLVEEIMEADVSSRTGAGYGERNPERVTQRNGYRSRAWDTRVGTMELQIPKLREGSYFPSLLEPRRRSERALGCGWEESPGQPLLAHDLHDKCASIAEALVNVLQYRHIVARVVEVPE